MTADASQQAERVVSAHELRVRRLQHETEYESEATSHDRLVQALAAAITTYEHYRNGSPYMEQVLDGQSEALSALGVEVDGPRPPVWEPDDDRVP